MVLGQFAQDTALPTCIVIARSAATRLSHPTTDCRTPFGRSQWHLN